MELPVIEVAADQLMPTEVALSSPALSPDGRRLAVQVERYRDAFLPYTVYSVAVAERDDAAGWVPFDIAFEGTYKKYLGRMESLMHPSFDDTGEKLLLTHVQFDSVLSMPSILSKRSWIERSGWRGDQSERVVQSKDWNLPSSECPQHGRISPGGRWLMFYTDTHRKHQGVYLLDLPTSKQFRLSAEHDKHPTWSATGQRIWFHAVSGGKRNRYDLFSDGPERAVIGFIDLTFDADGSLLAWQRHLMDDLQGPFVYHKHPAEVPGTDLLIFHGERKPGGKKMLMVRLTEPGSVVHELNLTCPDLTIKSAKHPCTSWSSQEVMFIAKAKGSTRYDLLLSLADEQMTRISRILHAAAQPPTHPPTHLEPIGDTPGLN